VQEEYIAAIDEVVGAIPFLLPALGDTAGIDGLDGLLLTGSPSNVEPHHYGERPLDPPLPRDPRRDRHNFAWIKAALESNLPLFGICRGFQELNVALGGSLYQQVHREPGKMDHRAFDADPLDVQYGIRHSVEIVPGGRLHRILGQPSSIEVNSLHGQGIRALAPTLVAEAFAPDGLVEAVSVSGREAFGLAVQWHPEWTAKTCAHSRALFEAFGEAARQHSGVTR
jgi:putative glutamine amidotransferase